MNKERGFQGATKLFRSSVEQLNWASGADDQFAIKQIKARSHLQNYLQTMDVFDKYCDAYPDDNSDDFRLFLAYWDRYGPSTDSPFGRVSQAGNLHIEIFNLPLIPLEQIGIQEGMMDEGPVRKGKFKEAVNAVDALHSNGEVSDDIHKTLKGIIDANPDDPKGVLEGIKNHKNRELAPGSDDLREAFSFAYTKVRQAIDTTINKFFINDEAKVNKIESILDNSQSIEPTLENVKNLSSNRFFDKELAQHVLNNQEIFLAFQKDGFDQYGVDVIENKIGKTLYDYRADWKESISADKIVWNLSKLESEYESKSAPEDAKKASELFSIAKKITKHPGQEQSQSYNI